jgi:hypothetical protein
MSDIEFVPGLIVKAPHERAPDFVKARIAIKREELLAYLKEKDGEWINLDVKVSGGGRWYAAVDNYKKGEKEEKPKAQEPRKGGSSKVGGGDIADDLPFRQERDRY